MSCTGSAFAKSSISDCRAKLLKYACLRELGLHRLFERLIRRNP